MQLQMNSFIWASVSVLLDAVIFPSAIFWSRITLNHYYTMY